MRNSTFSSVHPMVIFWLGLLTGAILVGLVFFYRVLQPVGYESAVIKGKTNISAPKNVNVKATQSKKATSTKSLPDPLGGKTALPDSLGG
mgnify:FL=1